MTPQRTKQAILALAPQSPAISDGPKGDITVAGNVWTVAPLPSSRVGLGNVANFAVASQAEAQAGAAADKYMTASAYEAGYYRSCSPVRRISRREMLQRRSREPIVATSQWRADRNLAIGVNGNGGVLQFPDDGATVISAQDSMVLTGTLISVEIWWRANVADASLNAVWQVQTACIAPDQDGDPSWNPAQKIVSSAHATANRWRRAVLSSVTATGCARETSCVGSYRATRQMQQIRLARPLILF